MYQSLEDLTVKLDYLGNCECAPDMKHTTEVQIITHLFLIIDTLHGRNQYDVERKML